MEIMSWFYVLDFEDKNGNVYIKGTFDTFQSANKYILEDLHSRGIHPYYFRQWEKDNVITIDFGSHSEFYHITKTTDNPK